MSSMEYMCPAHVWNACLVKLTSDRMSWSQNCSKQVVIGVDVDYHCRVKVLKVKVIR